MSRNMIAEDLATLRQEVAAGRVSLPGASQAMGRVRQALTAEEPDPRVVADMIRQDPGVSAYVIKTANSVAQRGGVDTGTVSGALQRLGLNLVGVLVTNFALMQMVHRIRGPYRASVLEIYRHSREVAVHCHALARSSARVASERALLAGLLHDVGKLATLHFASSHNWLGDDWPRLQALLEEAHPEVGAALLREWRFPESVAVAVAEHENWLRPSGDGEADLADAVIASQFDLRRDSEHPMGDLSPQRLPSLERLGVPPDVRFRDWPAFARHYEQSRSLLAL